MYMYMYISGLIHVHSPCKDKAKISALSFNKCKYMYEV